MDDFLHNLRSGKLKQADQSRRQYNDPQYKNQQRRGVPDRRRRDYDQVLNSESVIALKEALESISENQKRMAEALENRSDAEDRKAAAFEKLAVSLERMLSNRNEMPAQVAQLPEKPAISPPPALQAEEKEKLTPAARKKVTKLIVKMRGKSISYDKIAKHLAEEGYPTLSGKGKWRGQTIKRLYESA